MSDQNKKIVEQANAFLLDGKIEEFSQLCADDVKWTMLADTPTKINGRDGVLNFMATAEPENSEAPKFTVSNMLAEGDTVISNGDMTMKNKEGEDIPYAYCDIYKFKDGKIAELLTFINKTQAETEERSSASA